MDLSLADLAQDAGREAIKSVVKALVERQVGKPKNDKDNREKAVGRQVRQVMRTVDEGALASEVREAYRWAAEIQVQGMARPIDTVQASIPLTFAAVPRRFRAPGGVGSTFDEGTIVSSDDSFLVLGEPGSGKTTTLKRLTLSLFEESPIDGGSGLALPVVIVCRLVDWSETDLPTEILLRLGVVFERVRRTLELSPSQGTQLAAELLDASSCLLIVDGLDEIADGDVRGKVVETLARVRKLTNVARVICSSRSGDAPHLDGYTLAELLPLSPTQVADIASRRASAGGGFLDAVKSAGIDEQLLDRPLYLNQLLMVYESNGTLPERPVDLHRQLVRLLLAEWDRQRSVRRRSTYAEFDSDAKREFLSEVAFRLTIQGRAAFTERELVEIYSELHVQFRLPRNQALQVAREIESHVGLITETPGGFQFSHYTLQEYLCAESILGRPLVGPVLDYLRRFPAVVAVTVALSSDPTGWMSACLGEGQRSNTAGWSGAFASRLGLERPRFSIDKDLGEAVLKLMSQSAGDDVGSWRRLSEMKAVQGSVGIALENYSQDRRGTKIGHLPVGRTVVMTLAGAAAPTRSAGRRRGCCEAVWCCTS